MMERSSLRVRVLTTVLSIFIFLVVAGAGHYFNSVYLRWVYSTNWINIAAIVLAFLPLALRNVQKQDKGKKILLAVIYGVGLIVIIVTAPRCTYDKAVQLVQQQYDQVYTYSSHTYQPEDWNRFDPIQGKYLFVVQTPQGQQFVTVHPRNGAVQTDDSEFLRESIQKYVDQSGDTLKPV